MPRVGIIGAAGYAGIELVNLVVHHPEMELAYATSSSDAGTRIDELYPALRGITDLVFVSHDEGLTRSVDLVFLAVPHTAALDFVPALYKKGTIVIDLSADYRLKDPALYRAWYETEHTSPELLGRAVYGLPELDRDALPGATLIACPGCYPTAASLAAIPALRVGLTGTETVLVDAKSGVSGAGRSTTPITHYCAADESVNAYGIGTHRHTPEIEQVFAQAGGHPVPVLFAPHLVPMKRGLLATVYLKLDHALSVQEAVSLYCDYYADEPLVTVYEAGAYPHTRDVVGTNHAHIGVSVDAHTNMLVATCALDNLLKGASGQAVQCANIALGFDETCGLTARTMVV